MPEGPGHAEHAEDEARTRELRGARRRGENLESEAREDPQQAVAPAGLALGEGGRAARQQQRPSAL